MQKQYFTETKLVINQFFGLYERKISLTEKEFRTKKNIERNPPIN
jgi:hypothetical protein